jgi:hypothetical protein
MFVIGFFVDFVFTCWNAFIAEVTTGYTCLGVISLAFF